MAALVCVACSTEKSRQDQAARQLLERSRQLVDDGQYNAAKISLDSIHDGFPRLVDRRRAAAALMDSIRYLESLQTIAYTDTAIASLEAQLDVLNKDFVYERDDKYQTRGNLFHQRLKPQSGGITRSFLQPYVGEDMHVYVRSIYRGGKALHHDAVQLSSANDFARSGAVFRRHDYDLDDQHYEIVTFRDADADALLRFFATHDGADVSVELTGSDTQSYRLSAADVKALTQCAQLADVVTQLNLMRRQASQAADYVARYTARMSAG